MQSGMLYRLSGIVLLLGTILIVLFSGIGFELFGANQLNYLLNANGLIMLSQRLVEIETGPLWLPMNLSVLVGLILIVAGLPGMYAYLSKRVGWLGLIGFVLTMVGVLLIGIVNQSLYILALPFIAPHMLHMLQAGQTSMVLGAFYPVSSLLLSLGSFLLGFAILRAWVLPKQTRVTGIALIVTAVCYTVHLVPLPGSLLQFISIGSIAGTLSFMLGLAVFSIILVSHPEAERVRSPLISTGERNNMSPLTLYRLSGLAILVGSVLAFLFVFCRAFIYNENNYLGLITPSMVTNPLWAPWHFMAFIASVLILLGLPGMFVRLVKPAGWPGLIGFFLTFCAVLMLGVIDMGLYTFGFPLFASIAPEVLKEYSYNLLLPTLIAFYLVAMLVFCAGVIVFGRALIHAAVLPHNYDPIGVALISAGLAGAIAYADTLANDVNFLPSFWFLQFLGGWISALTFFIAMGVCGRTLMSRTENAGPIISRPLLYGTLTAIVVTGYVLVVGSIGVLVQQTRVALMISLIAIGLIAILIQPLRDRLQRAVNRLVYGERDNPYAVLSQLGKHMEATLAPESVLPTVVETIARSLKLPYVAIALKQDDEMTNPAAYGSPMEPREHFPLVYHGEQLGELVLSPRSPGEPLTPADQRLLHDLAPQIGVAVNAVRLTVDLQRSRERLVTAREEERRRLRRDLHDGLGPQLATLTLKLETARNRLANDSLSDDVLADLTTRTQAAVADIRRLVYALRPPALDELGLLDALREQAIQYGDQLHIQLDLPESLPPLSAAVEVALYRITQEALTNVVRHARASHCHIHLTLGEQANLLRLEIQDDGCGLLAERRVGVGLVSMQERAEELGGTFLIEPVSTGGTHVRTLLPSRSSEITGVVSAGIPVQQEEE